MIVRKAKIKDAVDILRIAQENQLVNSKDGNGFLVSDFNLEDYEEMIKRYEHFYVLENKEIQAFLFGYTDKQTDNSLIVNKHIIKHAAKEFFIIKQVCVTKKAQSKGFGSHLYEFIKENIHLPIYAAIVSEPFNEASVKFHYKHNFFKAFEVKAEDGKMRMLFCFEPGRLSKHYDTEILEQQYQVAVELYLHEDNLNWSKLNNLFYTTGGLVVVISFSTSFSADKLPIYIIITSLLGIITSFLFSVTISSGLKYMNSRKKSLFDLERLLIDKKGTKVALPKAEKLNKILEKSPTTIVMGIIPWLIMGVWAAALAFSTLYILFIT